MLAAIGAAVTAGIPSPSAITIPPLIPFSNACISSPWFSWNVDSEEIDSVRDVVVVVVEVEDGGVPAAVVGVVLVVVSEGAVRWLIVVVGCAG